MKDWLLVNRGLPVAPLVVVPWHELNEVVVESNTGLGVEDARPVLQ